MINTQSFSLDDAAKGVLLSFPSPSNLSPKSQYILYFDAPVILPDNIGTSVQFQPSSGSYSIIGSASFVPKVLVSVQSLYRLQTKVLLRLIIKDTSNSIIYTDYMMLVCAPESSTTISGKLLSNTTGNVGPNGGSIVQIVGSNQSTSTINIGDKIQGPGIPVSDSVYVKSIINSMSFELTKIISIVTDVSGVYTLIRSIGCVDVSTISTNTSSTIYTVLDVINNWTYKVRNQIIARFICDDPINNQDLIVFLPIKNTSLLAQENMPAPIPSISRIKAGGRVINDTVPISDI